MMTSVETTPVGSTGRSGHFDHLLQIACRALSAPVAVVALFRQAPQVYEAEHPCGAAAASSEAAASLARLLCPLFVISGNPILISDAFEHPLSREHLSIRSEINAFAGVPLRTPEGQVLGSLCVLDAQARAWTEEQTAILDDIAAAVVVEIRMRHHSEERRQEGEALRDVALHDALTGLPNRVLFTERLEHALARARRNPHHQFAVLFLDLNRFKVVNDSLGHPVGDELLVTVAQRLQRCLRPADTVARLGGDEFAILLEEIEGPADATRVAERIHTEISAPVRLSGYEVFTSTSIGIVLSSPAYDRPEHLLRNADMAMYRAKAAGQGRYEVFDRAMHAEALARLQVETDLRHAIERQEFRLHYQPIVALASGEIVGFEALVRWQHPERGLVPPGDFIPIAEETGMILPIGRWVLAEACRQLRAWHERFPQRQPLYMGVNLSMKQFLQPDLAEEIDRVLRESGLAPQSLKLEITESLIMEDAESASAILARMRSLGIQLYLDDFGTGYSSLSYLHRLPLDAVKIDRSFVSRMEDERRSAQLVRGILTLACDVGIEVIAEGINTAAQLASLRELRCAYGQGYLFSAPVDADAAEELLLVPPRW